MLTWIPTIIGSSLNAGIALSLGDRPIDEACDEVLDDLFAKLNGAEEEY